MVTYLRIVLAARLRSDRGASAVEYALMVASMAAVIVTVVFAFGRALNVIYEETLNNIGASTPSSSGPTP